MPLRIAQRSVVRVRSCVAATRTPVITNTVARPVRRRTADTALRITGAMSGRRTTGAGRRTSSRLLATVACGLALVLHVAGHVLALQVGEEHTLHHRPVLAGPMLA